MRHRVPQWEQKKARVAECSRPGKAVAGVQSKRWSGQARKASKTWTLDFTLSAVKTTGDCSCGWDNADLCAERSLGARG